MNYKINNHGNRINRRYSIDEVTVTGDYISQAAFYFNDRESARKRAIEILAEDSKRGTVSTLQE